ncbi:hypothetical protein [Frateuria defendens]|uniref:hypothetical protein n=1 Tax=Frateuria defendens TaxID=2219559 RepID=UPI00066FC1B5|nr:hypothetical protein [Frateuria defendens]
MPTLETFERSLSQPQPPADCTPLLQGLWWAAHGDWRRAHELVQALPGREAARVHAYLHRVEGDLDNAGYWYRQAGEAMPATGLEEEWRELAGRWVAHG